MSSLETRNPWRWVAALSAACGLAVIVAVAARGEASLGTVYPASALLVGGMALFARMSAHPRQWARAMNGPEARRFFALWLTILFLLGLAGLVVIAGFVSSIRG